MKIRTALDLQKYLGKFLRESAQGYVIEAKLARRKTVQKEKNLKAAVYLFLAMYVENIKLEDEVNFGSTPHENQDL